MVREGYLGGGSAAAGGDAAVQHAEEPDDEANDILRVELGVALGRVVAGRGVRAEHNSKEL